jgi:hypothetical protein
MRIDASNAIGTGLVERGHRIPPPPLSIRKRTPMDEVGKVLDVH